MPSQRRAVAKAASLREPYARKSRFVAICYARLMFRRLFPTLANLEPIELAILPIGVAFLAAPLSRMAVDLYCWKMGIQK